MLAGLCGAALALAAPARAEEISVVSFNVHGLPAWIARDDPAARMPEIGRLLSRYDVALVQEVWGYEEALAAETPHGAKLQGNAARSTWLRALGFLCGRCGSGLSLFTDPPRERVVASEAVAYDRCADWLFSANDCWATKGFQFVRLRLASGTELDVYNTHLEAGDADDDFEVRAAQLDELRSFVSMKSAGRAVILGGDLNLSHDDPRSAAAVAAFAGALGLRDSGARPADRSRWPERIDWILYREGTDIRLALTTSGEDLDFRVGDEALSDHPAVFARFRVTRAATGGAGVAPGRGADLDWPRERESTPRPPPEQAADGASPNASLR